MTEPPGVCGDQFEEARNVMVPARNANGTEGCMDAFGLEYDGGAAAAAAHVRALLYVCYGANGYFTGNG